MANSDTQVEVLLTANFSDLAAGMNGASAAVAESTDAMGASFKSFTADAATLDQIIGKNITSFAELGAAESALDRIQQSGAYSTEQLAVAFKSLDAAESALSRSANASTVALVEQSVATKGLTSNTRVMAEVATISSEIMSGNFGRIRRSAAALANQTGLLQKLFSPVGFGIAAIAVATGEFVYQVFKAQEVEAEFNSALLSTNYAAGLSLDGMNSLAQGIHAATGDMGGANTALLAMVKSGKFASDQLFDVGRASVEMSHMTGEAVGKVVKDFESLQHDPVNSVIKLNNEYHFLTVAVFDQIHALEKQGNVQAAAKVGIDAYANSIHQAALREEEDAGNVLKAWQATAEFFGNVKGMIAEWGSAEDKLRGKLDARDALNRKIMNEKSDEGTGKWNDYRILEDYGKVLALNKEINAERKKGQDAETAAQDKSIADKRVQTVIEETQAHDKLVASLKSEARASEVIADEKKRLESINKIDPSSDALKGFHFDASGQIQQTKQWTDEVAKLQKKYGDTAKAAKGASAAAHKATSESMVDLEQQRAIMKANGDDVTHIDQTIVDNAKRLYGEKSTQHRAALDRMLADQKSYARESGKIDNAASADEIRSRLNAYKSAHDAARESFNEKMRQAQDEYRDGNINALQLLNIEIKLNADMYASDLDYAKKREGLTKGELTSVQDERNAELKADLDSKKRQEEIDRSYYNTVYREANHTYQQIANDAANSVTSIIGGQVTLKQAMFNIGNQLLSNFIHNEAKKIADAAAKRAAELADIAAHEAAKVAATTAAEAARTGAVVAGSAARSAAEITAATTSGTITAGTAIKNIMAHAAEAFTGIYKAIAAIPYVGPFLAPVMAAAGFAVVAGYVSKVASAEKGWGRVPYDGMPAELHKDEMVLPKEYADTIRKLGNKGNVHNMGTTIHITAADSRSFADTLRRNPAGLMKGLRNAGLLGHSVGIMP